MFDIGFSEVLLIFVIALVVLGPEKLPRLASQVGRWVGRARAMARQFREQLEEEVNLEDERRKREAAKQQQKPPGQEGASAQGGAPTQGQDGAQSPGSPSEGSQAQGTQTPQTQGTQPGEAQPQGQPPAAGAQSSGMEAQSTPSSGQQSSPPPAAWDFSPRHNPDPADFRADSFSHAQQGTLEAPPAATVAATEPHAPAQTANGADHAANSEAYAVGTIKSPTTPSDNNGTDAHKHS
jgi:sec-independent protein translocase protein TatB